MIFSAENEVLTFLLVSAVMLEIIWKDSGKVNSFKNYTFFWICFCESVFHLQTKRFSFVFLAGGFSSCRCYQHETIVSKQKGQGKKKKLTKRTKKSMKGFCLLLLDK